VTIHGDQNRPNSRGGARSVYARRSPRIPRGRLSRRDRAGRLKLFRPGVDEMRAVVGFGRALPTDSHASVDRKGDATQAAHIRDHVVAELNRHLDHQARDDSVTCS
jgi:hypothetical protein